MWSPAESRIATVPTVHVGAPGFSRIEAHGPSTTCAAGPWTTPSKSADEERRGVLEVHVPERRLCLGPDPAQPGDPLTRTAE